MDLFSPRCGFWRELVLVAGLLACGICQGSAQMDIASLTGVVGQQSLLVIRNAPEDVQEYSWHRGANDAEENLIISYNTTSHSQQKGPKYSGRESVISTGALLIEESRLNDTGNYTVQAAAINDTQRATGWLEVQEFETLDISVNASIVLEDVDSMAAICHTNNTEVQWYVAHTLVSSSESTAISPDTKTLIIKRAKNYDSLLQCGVKIVLGTVIQRSELIYLTMAWFSQSVTTSTFLLDFLMAWSILGYVLLFTLILVGLIRCYSTRANRSV
ncbi:cell adhesion molecule CEACAM18-like isoform 3-T10 [Dama dama]|uniref:carcinoembryonic antigen-related cell adhesion molecule 18-like isoform X3 n=1 Tax=Dama dama TaxID=30532 RepID=UPI002A3710F6|nr:carcinoembryonic antigen-related cell adhesion molecule 18-like isoform X3 [Dama dama]XP_060995929.1 carcinoembryonic antigen-related cell adhesion molecule 18-like isoform X3 [Dama dama]